MSPGVLHFNVSEVDLRFMVQWYVYTYSCVVIYIALEWSFVTPSVGCRIVVD